MSKWIFTLIFQAASVLLPAWAADKHEHAGHSHGQGQLELVVQGGAVKANFEIPMESLLGFEHLPKTPAQKKAMADLQAVDLQPLDSPPARALMLKLAQYPEMLSAAARDFAPHDVSFYLRDLAANYHSYYDAERIWVDDVPLRQARMALVAATAQVLHNGLQMLGVSAPTSM